MSKPSGTESLSHNAATLEDLFFAKRDALLLKRKKEQLSQEEKRKSLQENTNFSAETIDKLLQLGLDYNSLSVVSLIPLLQVAWADGYMDLKESDSILRAAHSIGIDDDSVEFSLLEEWITASPNSGLFEAWKSFTSDSIKNLSEIEVTILKTQILKITKKVAESAGGFLGFASISAVEQNVIKQVETAFER